MMTNVLKLSYIEDLKRLSYSLERQCYLAEFFISYEIYKINLDDIVILNIIKHSNE